MSRFDEPQFEASLEKLRIHLRQEGYGECARFGYPYAARSFLRYLERRGQRLEEVTPVAVDRYVNSRRLKGSNRPYSEQFRRFHRAAIQMLLRVSGGQWPPKVLPANQEERADLQVIEDFDTWMKDLRGLSANTRRHSRTEARLLLSWMREHDRTAPTLSVADLDTYIAWRSKGRRRTGIAEMVSCLRGVLRHLHRSGMMAVDLAGEIAGPAIYALEGIPSAIRPEDVRRALKVLKQDLTPLGRRDYAVWMLLVTYGLRAGEIKALKLSDINWRDEKLKIRHVKTGAYSELPLLRAPAEAVLNYLRCRPASSAREVFLRAQAPHRAFGLNTSLGGVVSRRLAAAGVHPEGRCGPHALRHARAVSLLRGGVSLKVIGDVLGHRSERSTAVYLKLATEDLRMVALALPVQVAP